MDSEKKTALILGQRVEGVYLRSCNNNEIAKLVRWICLSPVKLGIILDGRSLVLGRNVTAVITNYAITSYVYVSKLSAGDVHNTWKVFDDELRRPERPAGRGRGSAHLTRYCMRSMAEREIPFVVHLRDCAEGMVAAWREGEAFGDPRFQGRVEAS